MKDSFKVHGYPRGKLCSSLKKNYLCTQNSNFYWLADYALSFPNSNRYSCEDCYEQTPLCSLGVQVLLETQGDYGGKAVVATQGEKCSCRLSSCAIWNSSASDQKCILISPQALCLWTLVLSECLRAILTCLCATFWCFTNLSCETHNF